MQLKSIAATVVTGSILTMGSISAAHAGTFHHEKEVPTWATKECKVEYQVNCHWTAWRHGNHRGHDFIVRQLPGSVGMVCVFYVETKFAATHDYCS